MANKSGKKNKRNFIRVNNEYVVRYQPVMTQNWYTTVAEDIGIGGIRMISMEYLGNGTAIKIRMTLTSLKKNIEVNGVVLWCDFLNDKNVYESGIKFVRLDSDEKELISKHISDILQNQTGISQT